MDGGGELAVYRVTSDGGGRGCLQSDMVGRSGCLWSDMVGEGAAYSVIWCGREVAVY